MQFKICMANHHRDDQGVQSEARIPVMQEELQVGRRTVDTGSGVRLNKTVSEEVWRIDDTLDQQTLDIEHVPVNAWVLGDPPVNRYEGNTLVLPVLEEVLVVEKRLRLTEEIRITAKSHQQPVSERVVLRKEHVSTERFAAGESHDSNDEPAMQSAPPGVKPEPDRH